MALPSKLPLSLRPSNSASRLGLYNIACAIVAALATGLLSSPAALAQTPMAFPYTMSTIAGLSPMSGTAGTQCPNLPTGIVSTDIFGDGCLAINSVTIGGSGVRAGLVVDSYGNVIVADDVNSVVHIINPTTGIMSVLAGKGTTCSGKVDSAGDGCLAATQTALSSPRGIGMDPYGNVYISGYGDGIVHMVCRTVSPNCTAAQVGYMEIVAGCISTTGGGSSSGYGLDNTPATSVGTTCTTSLGEVDGPRGMTADIYGNIYYADTSTSRTRVVLGALTSTFFSGNNPLYAALGVNYPSLTKGYVYTFVDTTGGPTCAGSYGGTCGGTPTTVGQTCSVTTNSTTYSGTALDTYGDGCPFEFSSIASSSGFTDTVAIDAAGNAVFTDPTHGLRVFYVSGSGTAGAKMKAAIMANDGGVAPQPGFIYMLAGGGGTTLSTTATLGSSTSITDSSLTKVTVSPQGNIYIGDGGKVLFYDINTGYVRTLFSSGTNVTAGNYCSGSSGPKSLTAYSDGCSANQSAFIASSGQGVAVDGQGNIYLQDASDNLVRKVLAQGFASETLGTAQIQNFQVHIPETVAGAVSGMAATLANNADMSAGSVTCGAQNGDFSFECTVPVTTTPSAPGVRSATLTVTVPFTPSGGSATNAIVNIELAGTASGSALALDQPAASSGTAPTVTTNTFFTSIAPAAVALDGAGNVYTMDTSSGHFLEYVQGTGSATLPGTLPTTPSQIAVDQLGDVFAVGAGTSAITELAVTGAPASAGKPATFTATSVPYSPISGTAAPQGIAVDQAGNLFVADKQGTTPNTAIYRLSLAPGTLQYQTTVATGFTNPVSLAVDPSGNVYVADKGAGAVYKLTPAVVAGIPSYTQTTALSGVVPVAVATDAAGDLYVQDSTSGHVIEVPVSGATTIVYTGLTTPSGLAVDGKGNVYSADAAHTSITQIVRSAVAFNFGTGSSGSPTFTGTLTDVGNMAITGSNTVTNTTNFAVVAGTTHGCTFTNSVLGAQTAGNACTLSANFVGGGTGTVNDVLTYLPAATTLGSLTLTGTLTGTAYPTTTTVGGQTPTTPAYSPSATEVTFTVTVASTNGTPGGTVAVTVDSTTTNPSLTNGVATVTVSGLTAGTHTISALYATNGSYTASNSGTPLSFTIAQDGTTVSWTPSATTQQYSAAIGTGVLDATAAVTLTSTPASGYFLYTATPTAGGTAKTVHAASFLAIGSYTLGVTFVPLDTVDYTSSTATISNYTVTKASTTAPVGTSQMLVASDGTGNYTSVQTALNALPNTGGSVYIKPGTYTGFVTVVKPNVALRGLGGDPTKVIITNEDGAFSPPYLTNQAAGNNGSTGDEGSATLVVAGGTVNGFSGTPNYFYGENFSVFNTWDTDSTNSDTVYYLGGSLCTANEPADNNLDLYNKGELCGGQALAIWTTSDLAVMNNLYFASKQDTVFAGAQGGTPKSPGRQYWFRGKITGDVDYIFGDAAAVFDYTSIYTDLHSTATGTTTVEAQNKSVQTGGTNDYLSGYIMNSDVFTSASTGMTALFYGRPYGTYSTYLMLNSYVDQVATPQWIEFSGNTNLPTSTYGQYNTIAYTDPTPGTADLNGVIYSGTGGNTGQGITSAVETESASPGTPMANNAVKTTLTAGQATLYYPNAFLGTTVNTSSTGVTTWVPTTALANDVNAYVPSGTSATVAADSSVTILMRPQVPGLGAVTNGTYTIPTGTYTLTDTFNSLSSTLASGTLDASGAAYYVTSGLATGTHSLTWTYGGDSNFSGSTTSSAYSLIITGTTPTTVLSPSLSPATYGQTETITAAVTPPGGGATPTGNFTLTIDGATTQTTALVNGVATFNITGLQAGTHTFTANSFGNQNLSVVVNQAPLTVTGSCGNRVFDTANVCTAAGVTGYQYTDSQATVFTGTPSIATTATRVSPAGNYSVAPVTASLALTTLGSADYTLNPVNTSFTITGNVPQSIVFPALPNFPHGGTYKLGAQTTSGLPVTYTVTTGTGIASVSGNTLTVTGTGPITIKASTAADPTGDYALATPVSQSFTAP